MRLTSFALALWLIPLLSNALPSPFDARTQSQSLLSQRANSPANSSLLETLSENEKNLFTAVIESMDTNYDESQSLWGGSPRYTTWYAVGLLARNQGNDVEIAVKLIRNALTFQWKDPSKAWFGTFKSKPTAPDPSAVYPALLYTSWDGNAALFVATAFIITLEEFAPLIDSVDKTLVGTIKESIYNATIGDGYRVGGVDGDNLYPAYSNPWLMRTICATYTGAMMNDSNQTYWGDQYATSAVKLFDQYSTLSEFNCGTYNGVSLYALSLWGYMPANSVVAQNAPRLISSIWNQIAATYNPSLQTLGGAFDRTYGFDMHQYVSILGLQITGLIGGIKDGTAPIPKPLVGSEHYGDASIGVLTPLVSRFHDPYVSDSAKSSMMSLPSPRTHFAQAISPPFDKPGFGPRNYTTFTGHGISVGGLEVDEALIGGPATSATAFTPGLILWDSGSNTTSWISHYPTSPSLSCLATSTNLTITYPKSLAFPNSTITPSGMTLLISGFLGVTLPTTFLANGTEENLPGLLLSTSGNVAELGTRTLVYGVGTINDLPYYNLTYSIPYSRLNGSTPQLTVTFNKISTL